MGIRTARRTSEKISSSRFSVSAPVVLGSSAGEYRLSSRPRMPVSSSCLAYAGQAAAEWRPVIEEARDPEILLGMVKLYHAVGDREAEQRAMERLRQIGGLP